MATVASQNLDASQRQGRSLFSRLKALLLTPLQFGALYFRPLWLLKAIKHAKPDYVARRLHLIFDPNVLRKKFNAKFKQNLVLVEAYGGTFAVDINDHLGYRFFMNDGFDSFLLWLGNKLGIQKGDILVDIGANVGSVCIPFALRFGAEIIAIEASKANCAMLLKNASLNKVRLQVHCNCAVDEQTARANRYLEFFDNNGNMAASSMFNRWNPSVAKPHIEFARTAVADQLIGPDIGNERIKLIKMDVEGAESIVLRGMRDLLKSNVPLAFEYRIDVMLRDLQDNGSEMIDMLTANHTIVGIEPKNGGYELVDFDPTKSYENALALPSSRVEALKRLLTN